MLFSGAFHDSHRLDMQKKLLQSFMEIHSCSTKLWPGHKKRTDGRMDGAILICSQRILWTLKKNQNIHSLAKYFSFLTSKIKKIIWQHHEKHVYKKIKKNLTETNFILSLL